MAERPILSVVPYPSVDLIINAFFTSAERAQTLDKPLGDIAKLASNEIAENFAAQGRPSRWEPLAQATIKDRITRGYGPGPILDREGTLKDDATAEASWQISGAGQVVVANLDVVGYGRFHISGTKHMPERDWTYTSEAFDEQSDQILSDWISEPFEALP